MSLRDNCHRLTKTHLTMGPKGPISVPALLDQLEAAVSPSSAGGATGSAKIRLPLDATALSLLQDIERDARDHQNELIPSFAGTLKAVIESWAVEDINGEWMTFLEHVTLDWIDRIESLLEPPKLYRPSAPCPHCGERFHGEERRQVLTVAYCDEEYRPLHPSKWRMECAACSTSWTGDDLGAIAHAIANQATEGSINGL